MVPGVRLPVSRMSPDDAIDPPDACDQCGGAPTLVDDGVPAFECEDCGNVLGLADPDAVGRDDAAQGPETSAVDGLSTGTVTASDGRLDQLVRLLESEADDDGTIRADRLELRTDGVTLVVTAADEGVAIRADREE